VTVSAPAWMRRMIDQLAAVPPGGQLVINVARRHGRDLLLDQCARAVARALPKPPQPLPAPARPDLNLGLASGTDYSGYAGITQSAICKAFDLPESIVDTAQSIRPPPPRRPPPAVDDCITELLNEPRPASVDHWTGGRVRRLSTAEVEQINRAGHDALRAARASFDNDTDITHVKQHPSGLNAASLARQRIQTEKAEPADVEGAPHGGGVHVDAGVGLGHHGHGLTPPRSSGTAPTNISFTDITES
jgi:hypothetical protein